MCLHSWTLKWGGLSWNVHTGQRVKRFHFFRRPFSLAESEADVIEERSERCDMTCSPPLLPLKMEPGVQEPTGMQWFLETRNGLRLLTTSKKMETLVLNAQKLISANNLNDQETNSPIESTEWNLAWPTP